MDSATIPRSSSTLLAQQSLDILFFDGPCINVAGTRYHLYTEDKFEAVFNRAISLYPLVSVLNCCLGISIILMLICAGFEPL